MPSNGLRKRITPHELLQSTVISLLSQEHLPCAEADLAAIPRHWEMFEGLVLLPEHSFRTPVWDAVSSSVWPSVAKVFGVTRVARHGRIQSNDFRSPRLELLLGDSTWVRKKENGMIFELDLEKSMFSSGNVTEKRRMLTMHCRGETVVDLFAGIGYFTVPLLKAGADKVYACEWNPDAVTALRRNIDLNGFTEKCEILFGDNRSLAPVGVADRVILGLIPNSEISWKTACDCLNGETGGTLHVHCNVNVLRSSASVSPDIPVPTPVKGDGAGFRKEQFNRVGQSVVRSLRELCEAAGQSWTGQLLHCECVKSYGPNIWHCVFDILLRPVK